MPFFRITIDLEPIFFKNIRVIIILFLKKCHTVVEKNYLGFRTKPRGYVNLHSIAPCSVKGYSKQYLKIWISLYDFLYLGYLDVFIIEISTNVKVRVRLSLICDFINFGIFHINCGPFQKVNVIWWPSKMVGFFQC